MSIDGKVLQANLSILRSGSSVSEVFIKARYVHVSIRMSVHTCMNVYIYNDSKRKTNTKVVMVGFHKTLHKKV